MATAAEIAERLDARPVRQGRWIAQCPAHVDRAPSLTIREGREGRVLLHCFAGCTLVDVLRSGGLTLQELFAAGPAHSPAERAADAAARAQQRAEASEQERVQRRAERLRIDDLRVRWQETNQLMNNVARRLATLPDGAPGSDALTACLHDALSDLRSIDRLLTGEQE